MARNKKKRPFKTMEITRIKLNPEQAVLSCCEQPEKPEVSGEQQCVMMMCNPNTNETSS